MVVAGSAAMREEGGYPLNQPRPRTTGWPSCSGGPPC